ncbi:MAG: hypothetical protein A2X19_09130 [Bacteroidetes bacterium GWE2_39_28]|nr:MAG: hypothetical protein A2X19_09130 [Bacteroidetes bacterium GWE2_39_28]OFY12131.1 MAG: hypothetical protein A2X16_06165 [Bacteroidetes bacterium GWF2_39_10]OFZ07599.1 MAG: hypothetical protein A2322_02030 [Bacteroidetes bacterium RIFOXYB2_FULL_39_7]OFZ10376.1 MAG: hypothetical protein A2465_02950 [Bacteroidetes bacterium RIFOXYC2_FULL_39_11]HCT94156.1 hypothetical protein [Rikenellaceae bacterium]
MKPTLKYIAYTMMLLILRSSFVHAVSFQTQEENFQTTDIKVKLSRGRGTIYNLLNTISVQTGYMFIYDSRLFDNDKVVRIPSGEFQLDKAVHIITGDTRLETQLIGSHILISLPVITEIPPAKDTASLTNEIYTPYFTMEGTVKDRISGEPVQYATISLSGINMGTVSNLDGNFKFILPDSLMDSNIKISHLGYVTREISAELLKGKRVTLLLDQRLIPLQEIVIRVVDPVKTIRDAMQKRAVNYSSVPVYHTSFYREGVEYKENLSHTEAVFKIYKTGYQSSISSEQVKLFKMRKFTNIDEKDTLVAKIKSSVYSSLLLDVVKNPPDFLSPETFGLYNYSHTDITVIDDRRVLVFSFTQKEHITEPLYQGEIYIDAATLAIVRANFRINPAYVNKTSDIFVLKRGKNVEIIPTNIEYMVSFKPFNDTFYVHHIRGDLNFRVRRAKRLFSSEMHAWFEMVNCETITENVIPIPRNERLPVRDILFETSYVYDVDFWGNFNTILPEDEITQIIRKYNF